MSKPLIIRDQLRYLFKIIEAMKTKEFATYGVTLPQMMIIREVYAEPKTIGHISKAIDLSYSTVSGIIDRLERNGMVERIRDKEDRRVVWIKSTGKIGELAQNSSFFSEDYYIQLFQELTDKDLDSIVHSLQMLTTQFEKKVEGHS